MNIKIFLLLVISKFIKEGKKKWHRFKYFQCFVHRLHNAEKSKIYAVLTQTRHFSAKIGNIFPVESET